MTDSATTLPQPSPDSYTVQDWIRILHNGSQVAPSHPQYTQVRQIMGDALARIAHLHLQQNEADAAAAQPGPAAAFGENMAQDMSMGLGSTVGDALGQGTSDFLSQARTADPKASAAGALVGSAIPSTILAAMGVPAGLAMGGPAGLQTGLETKSPIAGVAGGLGAAIGGKILGKATGVLGLNPLIEKGVGKLAGKFAAKGAAAEGGELIGGMTEADLRKGLVKQGFSDEALERAVAAAKAKMTPQVRTQAGGVTTELPAEKLSPIAGTEGRGFEVTGERATPPAPNAPTVAEIQERLGQARASYAQHTAESILPQPSGGATLTPKSAAPVADPTEPFPTARRITGTLQQAEEKAGRPLAPEEKEKVLAANVAKFNQQQFGKERAVLADVQQRMGRPLTQEEKRRVLKKLLGDYTKTQPWSPAEATTETATTPPTTPQRNFGIDPWFVKAFEKKP